MISKYGIAMIGAIAVVIGVVVALGPASLGAKFPIGTNVSNEQIGNLTQKVAALEQRVDQLNKNLMENGIDKIQKDIKEQSDEVKDDVSAMQAQVKKLSDQIDDLKTKMDKLTVGTTVLSAQLNKADYKPGDTLTLTGTGLPTKPVKVSLLDIDKLIISENTVTADSNGNYQFSTQLSRSYATGEYTVKLSQEGKVIERTFRIVGTETPSTQPSTQPPSTTQSGLTLSVDRNQYARGDKVLVSGKTDANIWIDLDIFDSNNVQLVRTSTRSDANGNYRYEYTIPSNAALGNYQIKVTLGSKEANVKFSVVSSTSSSTQTQSTSGSLTITTDKSQYSRSDLVKISGNAPAKSKVTILVEPSSGDTLLLTVTASDSGSYQTLFSIKADASTGTWNLTAKQDTDVVTAKIKVV